MPWVSSITESIMLLLVDKAKNVWFMIFQEIRPITGENVNVLYIFFCLHKVSRAISPSLSLFSVN